MFGDEDVEDLGCSPSKLASWAICRFGQDAEELRQRLVLEWEEPFPPPTSRTLALSLMAARGDSIGAGGGTVSARERGTGA